MEELHEYLCENCGAMLKVTPETIVAICEYCGAPNVVSGIISREDFYIVPSLGEEAVLEAFWNRVKHDIDLRSIANEIIPVSVEGSYIPFWLSKVGIKGEIVYRKKEYDGKEIRIKRVKKRFHRRMWVDLIARRQVKHLGLEELIDAFLADNPERIKLADLPIDRWREIKLPILNLEFDKAEAEVSIKDRAIDMMREEYERRVSEIEFFSAEVASMTKPILVFLPLWTITYRYKGSVYFAQHRGWSGEPLVFAEPIRAFRRITYFIGMAASTLLGGLSGYMIVAPVKDHISSFGIFLLIISASLGYFFGRKFVSDVRIERE